MKINEGITLAFLIWNLLIFLIYGIDKSKARRGAWRVPEKILLILAFTCGGLVPGWQESPFTTRLENGILKQFGFSGW